MVGRKLSRDSGRGSALCRPYIYVVGACPSAAWLCRVVRHHFPCVLYPSDRRMAVFQHKRSALVDPGLKLVITVAQTTEKEAATWVQCSDIIAFEASRVP